MKKSLVLFGILALVVVLPHRHDPLALVHHRAAGLGLGRVGASDGHGPAPAEGVESSMGRVAGDRLLLAADVTRSHRAAAAETSPREIFPINSVLRDISPS